MHRKLGSHFRSNVVAYLSLFVALGGTSAYAANTVFSTDIVDGEVKNQDIANAAVNNAKLANVAVGTGKIGASAVTTGTIANSAVTNQKLATDAVSKSKIFDASVGAAELGVGAVGPTELGRVKVKSVSFDVPDNSSRNKELACDAGQQIIGGGAGASTSGFVRISRPNSTGGEMTAWFAHVNNPDELFGGTVTATVYALCLDVQ